MDGVPGEPGAAEEAAVALGRHPHPVGRPAGDVSGHRTAQVEVLAELPERPANPGDRRRAFGSGASGGLAGLPRQRAAIRPAGVAAVDEEVPAVDDDLAVAASRVGLELEPQVAVGGRPQPPRAAGQQGVGALHAVGGEQVIGELDPGRDPRNPWSGQGVMDGVGKRLGGRRRPAAGRGQGDRGRRDADDQDSGAESQEPAS